MNPRDDITSLHYVGYDNDRGGIVAVVKALVAAGRFQCVLGVNETFRAGQGTSLPTLRFAPIDGERLCVRTFLRARTVAGQVRRWLAEDPRRVFHGHSRAGLAVALWLARSGEPRAVASVHCYGRQRWFYRWAAGRLGDRLFWLTPAMKRYYGVAGPGDPWRQCVPGCVAGEPVNRVAVESAVVRLAGIGALTPWKRWDLVLGALASLPADERARLRFIHIGGSDGSREAEQYASALRRRTEEWGLGGLVEWRGQQDSSRGLLAEADALVVASHNEPFSIAMLESLFAGVPVVAADSGGASDVVAPGVNGWLFRSGDAADLGRVLRDLAKPGGLGSARIDRDGLARFSAAEVAREWASVYQRLIATSRDAPARLSS